MAEVVLYLDSRGREPVSEYIVKLGRSRPAEAASIVRYIDLLESKGERLQFPFASPIDKKERIFELRPGNHRVAYALHAGAFVLLNAWRKQTQKLDTREAATARRRLADWRGRHP
jgi:phage-related protein